jgi:hypothetical protein
MTPASDAKAIDGQRAEFGRESETQDEIRAPMMVRMLILTALARVRSCKELAHPEGDDVDGRDGEHGRSTGDVVALYPKDH